MTLCLIDHLAQPRLHFVTFTPRRLSRLAHHPLSSERSISTMSGGCLLGAFDYQGGVLSSRTQHAGRFLSDRCRGRRRIKTREVRNRLGRSRQSVSEFADPQVQTLDLATDSD